MEKERLPAGEQLVHKIFSSVSFRGSKISSFSYERNSTENLYIKSHESGKCSFSIYGINCEKVIGEKFCVVSFKNGIPHFLLVLPFYDEKKILEHTFYQNEDFMYSEILKRLMEFGAKIESAKNYENSAELSFFISEEFLYSCLKICAVSFSEFFWAEEFISIVKSEEKFYVKLRYKKSGEFFSDILSICSRFAYLFGEKRQFNSSKMLKFKGFWIKKPFQHLTVIYK